MKKHWQDWANLVLGLWILISPWVLQGGAASGAAMWSLVVVGRAIAALAVAALISFRVWEEWTNLAFGAWLLVSPWVLGFAKAGLLTWSTVIAGTLVVILAGWAIAPSEDSPAKHA